mgnify:FL=1
MSDGIRALLRRWLKFNVVGAIGIFVQLAALALLRELLRFHYLAATALAVETAVLHNFVWHERWTWAERRTRGVLGRLARFNFSTGLVSIVSNLVVMRLLVGWLGLHYLAANLLSIAAASLANFLLSELFVFRAARD